MSEEKRNDAQKALDFLRQAKVVNLDMTLGQVLEDVTSRAEIVNENNLFIYSSCSWFLIVKECPPTPQPPVQTRPF
jgi:hypothetical protein